jgi:hypothetical protein
MARRAEAGEATPQDDRRFLGRSPERHADVVEQEVARAGDDRIGKQARADGLDGVGEAPCGGPAHDVWRAAVT